MDPSAPPPPVPPASAGAEELRRWVDQRCEALSPPLYAWARLRLRGFPRAGVEAEDVVQETWLRALGSAGGDRERLQEPGGFRAWLFGVAQNVLLEELRRRPSSEGRRGASSSGWLGRELDTVTSICTGLSRHELVLRVLEFTDTLDDLDQQLLLRCAFEEVSASDVGRRLGHEPATAIKRWQRLRERLASSSLRPLLGL